MSESILWNIHDIVKFLILTYSLEVLLVIDVERLVVALEVVSELGERSARVLLR